MSQNLESVTKLIKKEIESIKTRDGQLDLPAYVVTEIVSRLKTLQGWEGRNPNETMARSIRTIAEPMIRTMRARQKVVIQCDGDNEFFDIHQDMADRIDWSDPKKVRRLVREEIAPKTRHEKLGRVS